MHAGPGGLARPASLRRGLRVAGSGASPRDADAVARGEEARVDEEEVGGDGFLFFNSYFDRRYVIEVCDGLVPELQRRGLTREAYAHRHLRDNLLEF